MKKLFFSFFMVLTAITFSVIPLTSCGDDIEIDLYQPYAMNSASEIFQSSSQFNEETGRYEIVYASEDEATAAIIENTENYMSGAGKWKITDAKYINITKGTDNVFYIVEIHNETKEIYMTVYLVKG